MVRAAALAMIEWPLMKRILRLILGDPKDDDPDAETRPFPDEGGKVVYEIARDRLVAQLSQMDGLDGKLATFLGFGSAMIGILAAFLGLREEATPAAANVFLGFASFFYLLLAGLCLYAYRIRGWDVGPKLGQAWQYSRSYTERQMWWWAAEAYTRFYQRNRSAVQPKVLVGRRAMQLLALESGAIVLALLVVAFD